MIQTRLHGETKNACGSLASAEAEQVGKQRIQKGVALLTERGGLSPSGNLAAVKRQPFASSFHTRGSICGMCPRYLLLPENPFLIGRRGRRAVECPGWEYQCSRRLPKTRPCRSDRAIEKANPDHDAGFPFSRNHYRADGEPVLSAWLSVKILPANDLGDFERPIGSSSRRSSDRCGMLAARASEVGIRKIKIHGDAHQRLVACEQRNSVHLVFRTAAQKST